MRKRPTLADITAARANNPSNFNEGSYVTVTCSQSSCSALRIRSAFPESNIHKTLDKTLGFPLKVSVDVRRRSTLWTSSAYITDHKAEKTFWIPFDDVSSDRISKGIFLMNIPFPLSNELKWSCVSCDGVQISVTLANKEILISKITEFAKSMEDCPNPLSDKEFRYMCLGFTKITYLPEVEFTEIYANMRDSYNYDTWVRTQEELDKRIEAIEALEEGVKKMRLEEACNSMDLCLICMEVFQQGSVVCEMKQCSHVYHEVCILQWLLRNRTCPYCRTDLAPASQRITLD